MSAGGAEHMTPVEGDQRDPVRVGVGVGVGQAARMREDVSLEHGTAVAGRSPAPQRDGRLVRQGELRHVAAVLLAGAPAPGGRADQHGARVLPAGREPSPPPPKRHPLSGGVPGTMTRTSGGRNGRKVRLRAQGNRSAPRRPPCSRDTTPRAECRPFSSTTAESDRFTATAALRHCNGAGWPTRRPRCHSTGPARTLPVTFSPSRGTRPGPALLSHSGNSVAVPVRYRCADRMVRGISSDMGDSL